VWEGKCHSQCPVASAVLCPLSSFLPSSTFNCGCLRCVFIIPNQGSHILPQGLSKFNPWPSLRGQLVSSVAFVLKVRWKWVYFVFSVFVLIKRKKHTETCKAWTYSKGNVLNSPVSMCPQVPSWS
jgi:hypothetical protein